MKQEDEDKISDKKFTGFRHGVRTATSVQDMTLIEFLAVQLAREVTSPSLTTLELIELGSVYVNNERSLEPSMVLKSGSQVRIHTLPRRFSLPQDLLSRIIAEDELTLLVEKPAGLPSEPVVDNFRENLLSFLEETRGQRLFLTNRLTTESEGLLLVAKTPAAQKRVIEAFAQGRIRRRLVAFVEDSLPEKIPECFSLINQEEFCTTTQLISENRKTWEIIGTPISKYFRLEIEATKARPKEIREELAAMGAFIIGDCQSGSRFDLRDSQTRKSAMAFATISLQLLD